MSNIILQLITAFCFLALIIVLFNEKSDYLTYSILLIIIAGVATALFIEDAAHIEFYVDAIEWDVIFFLIGMFTIVEVLNEKMIFQEISKRIVNKYKDNHRKMFYVICIVSTLTATILEDLSVAIIFGPIIVIASREIKMNPTPFLLGMTICINLAATLTPFGSAQNILIVSALDLDIIWFLRSFGLYFVFTTAITLFLLDKFMLSKYEKGVYEPYCYDDEQNKHRKIDEEISHIFYEDHVVVEEMSEVIVDDKTFRKNIAALFVFVILLLTLPNIYLPALIGALIFIFINPVKNKKQDGEESHPSISYYFSKVDYKLIYFFFCLFILVGLMEANGTIALLEIFIESLSVDNIFLLSLIILVTTSVLSGFMDNAPVTVMFLPIIQILINQAGFAATPLIIAFILGINLGGNFLPQGSACDMMTLEIARENCVEGFTYKLLFKMGGLFALIHILLGIVYLVFIIYIFPI